MKKMLLAAVLLLMMSVPSQAALVTVTWMFGGGGNAANETSGIFQSEAITIGSTTFTLGLSFNPVGAESDATGLGAGPDALFTGGESLTGSLGTLTVVSSTGGTTTLGPISNNDFLTATIINFDMAGGAGGIIDASVAVNADGTFATPQSGVLVDFGNMGSEFQVSELVGVVELTTEDDPGGGGATAVPEPSSFALMSLLSLGLAFRRRRQ